MRTCFVGGAFRSTETPMGKWNHRELGETMSDKIIDGKKVAEDIHAECLAETKKMLGETGKVPGLAVILVGERKDSQTYVRNKERMCMKDGIKPFDYKFPADISEVCCEQWIGSFSG